MNAWCRSWRFCALAGYERETLRLHSTSAVRGHVDPGNHERQKTFVPYLQQARSLLLETVLGLKFTAWVIAPWKILPRGSVKGLSHSNCKRRQVPFPSPPRNSGLRAYLVQILCPMAKSPGLGYSVVPFGCHSFLVCPHLSAGLAISYILLTPP